MGLVALMSFFYAREKAMKVDMSPQAITLRLKRVSQLRDLCLSLSKAKKVKRENDHLPSQANQVAANSR